PSGRDQGAAPGHAGSVQECGGSPKRLRITPAATGARRATAGASRSVGGGCPRHGRVAPGAANRRGSRDRTDRGPGLPDDAGRGAGGGARAGAYPGDGLEGGDGIGARGGRGGEIASYQLSAISYQLSAIRGVEPEQVDHTTAAS